MMSPPAAAAFLLLLTVPAMSQEGTATVEIDGVPIRVGGLGADVDEAIQWKVLQRKGIDSNKKLHEEARKNLVNSEQLPHEFQRVEIAGVGSIDDTDAIHPGMIDKQIKTSNLNEVFPSERRESELTGIPRVLRDGYNRIIGGWGKDVREALSDTRGIPSVRSYEIINQLRYMKINELFAHSWGTEVVYLAILNGYIDPPKKLIVMGVPEDNQEKWLALAKYTGTEVHVVGFKWDKLKMLGTLATKFKSGLPRDTAGLNKLWGERCAKRTTSTAACADPTKFVRTRFDYNVHVRPPSVSKDALIQGTYGLDHERMDYLKYLNSRNLFNKTVAELEAPQLPLIKAEENRILEEAMGEARTLIDSAKLIAETEAIARRKRLDDELRARELAAIDKREREEREDRERQARRAAEDKRLVKERRDEDIWRQIEADAAKCGYEASFQNNSGIFMGFKRQNEYLWFRPTQGGDMGAPGAKIPQLDLNDLNIMLLVGNTCFGIRNNVMDPPPPACNESASVLHARSSRSDFPAKLDAMFGRRSDRRECVNEILDHAGEITDSAAFNRHVSAYHKEKKNAEKKQRKAYWKEYYRRQRQGREEQRDGDSEPREPGGCIPGDNSRRNCIACGNKYCG